MPTTIGTPIPDIILTKEATPTKDSYGYGIAISGSDVYVGGMEDGKVKYWKSNAVGIIDFSVGTATQSSVFNNCIAVNGNNIYI